MNQTASGDISVTLVATKVAAPLPIPGLVERPDLVERLVQARGRITLISAPAGWGKTSLLSAWISTASEERPFAFLNLEPADDNGALFWTYVIAALNTVHPHLMSRANALLRNPDVDPQRQIVPTLVNELSAIAEPLVLILDDYHVITQPTVHDSVGYLADHLPPTTHLAITTRTDPPLPLGRLRASGELTELRARDLQFTDRETADLLNDRFGLAMGERETRLLRRRTEGWPAALHLAGLSLRSTDDRVGFVERFAGDDRNVADYLTSEVLDQLPAKRREFLLRTSVLDHLTGPLCDVVAEVENSAATLEELYHDNLFVVPLDTRRQWYRYHHLFAEWLRHELRRTNPTAIAGLHSRASRWHADNHSISPAISHAMVANEFQLAADLMDRYLTDLETVQWGSVRRWLSDLPDEFGSDHPMVASAQLLFALARGDFTSGRRWADIAEAAVGSDDDGLHPAIEKTVALFRALSNLVAGDMDGRMKRRRLGPASTPWQAATPGWPRSGRTDLARPLRCCRMAPQPASACRSSMAA